MQENLFTKGKRQKLNIVLFAMALKMEILNILTKEVRKQLCNILG